MKNMMNILRGLREDKDVKQSEIAELIGTTQQQYSKYETGESELPVRALVILADYYGVPADYLLGRKSGWENVTGMERTIADEVTAGDLLSDVFALGQAGRRAVLEYVYLQQLKQKYGPKDE